MTSWDDENFDSNTPLDEEEKVADNWDDEDEEDTTSPKEKTSDKENEAKERLSQENGIETNKTTVPDVTPEVPPIDADTRIDFYDPKTPEDFQKLILMLQTKLLKYEKSAHYNVFLESLFREVVTNLDMEPLKRMSTMFNALANEKQKAQKVVKGKKKSSKAKMAVVRDNDFNPYDDAHDDDFDDFM